MRRSLPPCAFTTLLLLLLLLLLLQLLLLLLLPPLLLHPLGRPSCQLRSACTRLPAGGPCGFQCPPSAANCTAGNYCGAVAESPEGWPTCLPVPSPCGQLGGKCCPVELLTEEQARINNDSFPSPFCWGAGERVLVCWCWCAATGGAQLSAAVQAC